MSGTRRLLIAGVGLVVVVAAFLIARSGSSDSAPATTGNKVIVVQNGKPVGGVQKLTVKKGGRVTFTVKSDVADEIHVHGYNFHKDIAKGGSVSFNFPATIDGEFVIELETRSEQIASLEVKS
jgi:plastocyanin